MPSLPVASVARPLRLRKRDDLIVYRLRSGSTRGWGVKDPVSLRYYHLSDEEHFVWTMLDGNNSAAEIQQRFAEKFPPSQLSIQQIQQFLGLLHDATLIISDSSGQAGPLLERAAKCQHRDIPAALTRLLAFRFRGIDAEWLLNSIYRRTRWLFSGTGQGALALIVLGALVLVYVNLPALTSRLPEARALFSGENLVVLVMAISITKILHELGHGLACRHFGGESHEIGIMLLFFTPCLYCNVTDAWTFPDRWKRIAVSAAGIWVEIILAGICTILWWYSEPGWLNSLCLNMMVVGSISTVLLNGNPLLRFDGYYVFSDFMDVPNLGPRAARYWKDRIAGWLLAPGDDSIDFPAESDGRLLFIYGIASAVYRTVLLGSVLWGIYQLSKPFRLESVAAFLTVGAVFGLLYLPVVQLVTMLADRHRRDQLLTPRVSAKLLGIATIVLLLLLTPLPYRVSAPLTIEPEGAARVYVRVPGTVVAAVPEGTRVKKDDVILRLRNLDFELDIERLRGSTTQQRLRLENLRRRQSTDLKSASEIPTAVEILADLEERLRQKLLEGEKLLIRAPVAGVVLPPKPREPPKFAIGLRDWNWTPLNHASAGCYLDIGTEVCLIGDPTRMAAMLMIDQSDVELVRQGQSASLILDERPAEILRGSVSEVAEVDQRATYHVIKKGTPAHSSWDRNVSDVAFGTAYQARVTFDGRELQWLPGGTGRGKIVVTPLSIWQRLARYLNRTFRMEL